MHFIYHYKQGNVVHSSSHNNTSDTDDSFEFTEEFTEEFTLSNTTKEQIAKPLTKSTAFLPKMIKWRRELSNEEGKNKCDVLDSVHKWYTCTILEVDPWAIRFKINYDGW